MIKLKELFEIEYGNAYYENTSELKEGPTPLIASGASNFGIKGYYNIPAQDEMCISVARTGSVGYAFAQLKPCVINSSALILRPFQTMTTSELIYYAEVITQERIRFNYARKVTPKRLNNIEIEECPLDWKEEDLPDYSWVKEPALEGPSPELTNLQAFVLSDLFEIKRPKVLHIENTVEGKTPFITCTSVNNGLDGYISLEADYKAGTITLAMDGKPGIAFYQPKDYCASDRVNILTPKFSMNEAIGLFICNSINNESWRFNYGRKCTLERSSKLKIGLPAKEDGTPNFELMEDWVLHQPYSAILKN